MLAVTNIFLYACLFLSLFTQVFLLITYFEKRAEIHDTKLPVLKRFPETTIIVPVWNEARTIAGTLHSRLNQQKSQHQDNQQILFRFWRGRSLGL